MPCANFLSAFTVRDLLFRFFLFCWLPLFGLGFLVSASVSGSDEFSLRETCFTEGTWNYNYDATGQAVYASHPSLGNFSYLVDGIGRRGDANNANADPLNRFLGMAHSGSKKLSISADPDARLWVNAKKRPRSTAVGSTIWPRPARTVIFCLSSPFKLFAAQAAVFSAN